MNKQRIINQTTRLTVCLSLLLAAGCSNPWQGAGALYIAEKGEIKCVNVDSVAFISGRHTTYKIAGKEYITQAALEYYSGQECS